MPISALIVGCDLSTKKPSSPSEITASMPQHMARVVVFIHGIHGSVEETWKADDRYSPSGADRGTVCKNHAPDGRTILEGTRIHINCYPL